MIEAGIARTVDVLADAFDAAGVDLDEVDAILLTGGSSRIPRVAQLLSERFDRPDRHRCRSQGDRRPRRGTRRRREPLAGARDGCRGDRRSRSDDGRHGRAHPAPRGPAPAKGAAQVVRPGCSGGGRRAARSCSARVSRPQSAIRLSTRSSAPEHHRTEPHRPRWCAPPTPADRSLGAALPRPPNAPAGPLDRHSLRTADDRPTSHDRHLDPTPARASETPMLADSGRARPLGRDGTRRRRPLPCPAARYGRSGQVPDAAPSAPHARRRRANGGHRRRGRRHRRRPRIRRAAHRRRSPDAGVPRSRRSPRASPIPKPRSSSPPGRGRRATPSPGSQQSSSGPNRRSCSVTSHVQTSWITPRATTEGSLRGASTASSS